MKFLLVWFGFYCFSKKELNEINWMFWIGSSGRFVYKYNWKKNETLTNLYFMRTTYSNIFI